MEDSQLTSDSDAKDFNVILNKGYGLEADEKNVVDKEHPCTEHKLLPLFNDTDATQNQYFDDPSEGHDANPRVKSNKNNFNPSDDEIGPEVCPEEPTCGVFVMSKKEESTQGLGGKESEENVCYGIDKEELDLVVDRD